MFGHGKYGNANRIPTIRGFLALALVGVTTFSPTERNPRFRNHHRRRSPGNGQEGEAPPWIKSHVTNPTKLTFRRSKAQASIYGKLQVTSRYHSGTLGGLGPGAKKNSRSGNFEFHQLLVACFGMGNMAMPTASPPSVAF